MRLFVERFALTVLAAALIYVVTHQIHLSVQVRIAFSAGIVIAALLASHFGEKRYADGTTASRSPRYFLPLSIAVALGTIGFVVYVLTLNGGENPEPQTLPTTASSLKPAPNQDDSGKASTETSSPTPGRLRAQTADPLPPLTKSRDVLTEYLSTTTPAQRPSSPWPVLMYDGNGKEYSILRATAQSVLQENGNTTPSIFWKSIAPDRYTDLFNADVSLIARLRPYCDGLVMGLVRSTTSASDQVSGMYTTHISADVKQVSTSDGIRHEFNIEGNGTGFDVETSQSNAEERLAQKFKTEFVTSLSK
jgi:hypothetical protein